MRAVYGVWLAALAVASTICGAETQFPYELTIERDGVAVRSGPSRDFYLTDRLSSGETIEVYRREPGGWLAIRPPTDSFSLVKQSQLKPSPSGSVATVLHDGTVCRVGSRIADTQPTATHVLLHAGELVELLETSGDDDPSRVGDEDETWVRIWPPAGEFRWVRATDLRQPDDAATRDDKDRGKPANSTAERSELSSETPGPPTGVDLEQSISRAEAASETVRVPTEVPIRVSSESTPSQIDTGTEDQTASKPLPPNGQPNDPSDESEWRERTDAEQTGGEIVRVPFSLQPTQADATAGQDDSEKMQVDVSEQETPDADAPGWVSRSRLRRDDLDGLKLELAMMVSQEMRAWRLDSLSKRVEQAATRLSDPAEQTRAKELLKRIGEFEHLLDRANGATQIGLETDSPRIQPLTSPSPNRDEAAAQTVKYDGSGWLVPVHASKGTVPPYALLDVQGDVMHYVSPTPGLNLQRYLRKRIGVFGQQGFVRSLNKPHVTAERVVDLDRHLR